MTDALIPRKPSCTRFLDRGSNAVAKIFVDRLREWTSKTPHAATPYVAWLPHPTSPGLPRTPLPLRLVQVSKGGWRHELRPNPQPGNDDYELRDYMIDSSYTMIVISRRTIPALLRPESPGIPAELQEKFAAMLNKIGAHPAAANPTPAPKTRPYSPSCLLHDDGVTVNQERVRRLIQLVRGQAHATWRPDAEAARDAADRDAAEQATSGRVDSTVGHCTCSGVRDGGECNCPWNTGDNDRA